MPSKQLMELEVEGLTGAGFGEKSSGCRAKQRLSKRDWETRASAVELRIPKLRKGSYSPAIQESHRMVEKSTRPAKTQVRMVLIPMGRRPDRALVRLFWISRFPPITSSLPQYRVAVPDEFVQYRDAGAGLVCSIPAKFRRKVACCPPHAQGSTNAIVVLAAIE